MYAKCNSARGTSESRDAFRRWGNQYAGFGAWAGGGSFRRPKYNVPINIIEHDTHYQVNVYALGFDKENIKVFVSDDELFISGSRPVDEGIKPNFRWQEYPIKSFERVISLRGQVDTTNITAMQEEGILKVILPKTPQAKKNAQEIQVL